MPGSLLGFRPACLKPDLLLTLLICAPRHIQPILHLDYATPPPQHLFSIVAPVLIEEVLYNPIQAVPLREDLL